MPPPYDSKTTTTELVTDYTSLIKGKVVLTTGVTLGSLGGAFVQSIAKANPACLILAGRNLAKLDQCGRDLESENPNLRIFTVQIDLGSLSSVRDAAAHLNSNTEIPVIDVLVNNAGIMAVDYALSDDGVESQFATNHLGPFLFTNLIMGKILRSESPRVVMVASDGHRLSHIRFDDYNFDVSASSGLGYFPCLTCFNWRISLMG
jgi:NAD(P)-dependent dehydrogenase (short-subunit alcohol dehydrogenase family)